MSRPRLPIHPLPAALLLLLLLCIAALPAPAARQEDAPPASEPASVLPKEVRGMWVVRTDLTSRSAVSRVITHAKRSGINTLFLQCRGRGDAYYRGGLEPRAEALARCGPDFDPLMQAVTEAQAAGLRAHAWVNACYVWSDRRAPKATGHLVHARRDWLAVDRAGRRCAVGQPEVFVCPGNPEAREHLAAICGDIARRYPVDGIQLDYIRYSGPGYCYCNGCLERFRARLAGRASAERLAALRAKGRTALPQAYPADWTQFRRDQVTELVRAVRAAVREARPAALLTAAVIPWGNYNADFRLSEAYRSTGQDWYGWIRAGLVDAVCPMTYQAGMPGFKSWVHGVRRDHPDFPVWFGIGAYLFGPESAAAKVNAVRAAGGRGWVLFSYGAVTRGGTSDAYLQALKARVLRDASARR